MTVQRYDLWAAQSSREAGMEEASTGHYVEATDYDALAAELADMTRKVRRTIPGYHKKRCRGIREPHPRTRIPHC